MIKASRAQPGAALPVKMANWDLSLRLYCRGGLKTRPYNVHLNEAINENFKFSDKKCRTRLGAACAICVCKRVEVLDGRTYVCYNKTAYYSKGRKSL